jgi:hypothetical protein
MKFKVYSTSLINGDDIPTSSEIKPEFLHEIRIIVCIKSALKNFNKNSQFFPQSFVSWDVQEWAKKMRYVKRPVGSLKNAPSIIRNSIGIFMDMV